jgi:2-aminoadipate transaminase
MNTIHFTRGIPADESYPLEQLANCAEAVMRGPNALETMKYGTGFGFTPLREILAAQNNVKLENVIVGNGSLGFIDLMGVSVLEAGDTVFVESPTYDRVLTLFKRHGIHVVGIPLEPDGINLEALTTALEAHKPKIVYLIADFQNPSGATMSLAKRQAVVELAVKHDFLILEDAPYRPLRYRGTQIASLRELNPERVMQMSSYTKQISPGVRVGSLIGPAKPLAQLAKAANDTYISAAFLGQATVAEFLQRGLLEPQLESLRNLYRPRLEAIIAALETYLPNASFIKPDGGFFLSVALPEGSSVTALMERGQDVNLTFTDGRGFFPVASDGERFLRLPFCALTPEELREGIKRLSHIV